MTRYRARVRFTTAEKIGLAIALALAVMVNFLFAFTVIGLPMILLNAPTWAWVGCTAVAVYASIDAGS